MTTVVPLATWSSDHARLRIVRNLRYRRHLIARLEGSVTGASFSEIVRWDAGATELGRSHAGLLSNGDRARCRVHVQFPTLSLPWCLEELEHADVDEILAQFLTAASISHAPGRRIALPHVDGPANQIAVP